MAKDLVQVIKDNPGCVAVIDNDCWSLRKGDKRPDFTDDDWSSEEAWELTQELASDDDIKPLGDGGYGSGNCYGGDVLQALAQIVGIKVESV